MVSVLYRMQDLIISLLDFTLRAYHGKNCHDVNYCPSGCVLNSTSKTILVRCQFINEMLKLIWRSFAMITA